MDGAGSENTTLYYTPKRFRGLHGTYFNAREILRFIVSASTLADMVQGEECKHLACAWIHHARLDAHCW